MSDTIKLEESSENVFLDIGFSQEESERELLRSDLAFEIYCVLKERKLTGAKAGEVLGIDQSDVSRLKNGDSHCFNVEHLLMFLNRLNRNCEIGITPTAGIRGR